MRHVLAFVIVCWGATISAQGFQVVGGGGYSMRPGDESARSTYAWQVGAGYRSTLGARWKWEADLVFARSSYKYVTAVKNRYFIQSTNAVTALGMAQWNTNDDAYSPFIGGGLFGSVLIGDFPGFRSFDVGPALGVGLQWEGGRLMLHYQHSVTQIGGIGIAAGYATVAVHL